MVQYAYAVPAATVELIIRSATIHGRELSFERRLLEVDDMDGRSLSQIRSAGYFGEVRQRQAAPRAC